ncbi:uncharacterized protein B0H64DRAFT_419338 [Chaetomium fimeti]|uniref:Enoyl reductase (ER) domain-containing protein n=1 Tax=Chaetomium fimeti TaxID=1854472 RepID=A0AAE0HBU4_9PEZI|nr:hypothetical protein B0H64DRAFT_419338 [Chaetomium fimeti]
MPAIQILGPKTHPTVTLNPAHPLPPHDPSAVLIRVHAAGLTADELSWPELYTNPTRIPGCDVSGTVVALPTTGTTTNPPSVVTTATGRPLNIGDAVYTMQPANTGSGQAGYAYALPQHVAHKPSTLTHAQAAALPIPVLTAWEGLFKRAGASAVPERGGRVLVTGASGAVGRTVVQLVKGEMGGVEVVALASGPRGEEVRGLGADVVVDYGVVGWERAVGRVDVVFDVVGGEVLETAWRVVRDEGVLVTVSDPPPAWGFDETVVPPEVEGRPGLRYVYFIVSPDGEALEKVAGLIDEGALQPLPVVEFPLEKAVEAWEFAKQRGRQGKVVINFVEDN